MRRHVTVLVLTPSRLILAHTDEHPPDDMLPAPYTSSSTEAVTLSAVRSVVVNRMVANPASYAGRAGAASGRQRGGAHHRLGRGRPGRPRARRLRRPRLRGRPRLHRAAHLRRLLAAGQRRGRGPGGGGEPAGVRRRALRPHRRDDRRPASSSRPTRTAPSATCCPRSPAPSASTPGLPPTVARAARGAQATSCSSSTAWASSCCATTRTRRRSCTRCSAEQAARDRRGALHHRHQPDVARAPRCRPGAHGVVGFTSRIPGTDDAAQRADVEQVRRPAGVAAAPHGLRPAGRGRRATTVVNKREFAGSGLTLAGQRGAEFVGRGQGRGADRCGAGAVAHGAVADLHVRRRPRLDRPPLRRRLRRRGSCSCRWSTRRPSSCARRCPPTSGSWWWPTTAWSTRRRSGRLDVDEHPELLDGVALLGGEARFRHLYCRGGAVDDVARGLARARSATGPRC